MKLKLGLILSKQTDKYINISEQFKNFGNQWIVDYYIKYLFSLLARVDLTTVMELIKKVKESELLVT